MGREVRMVPTNWMHPKITEDDARFPQEIGRYKPLYDGEGYAKSRDRWLKMANESGVQEAIEELGNPPNKDDYMPQWNDQERTHFMMYEDTSEGTPISPAFATAEELARWLADNNASAFAGQTASYEAWLATIKRGWAVSAVLSRDGMQSGVTEMAKHAT